jgi:Carboxypeptidase regulatory-like domain
VLTRRYWHAFMRSISSCSRPALHLPVVFCIFSLMSSVTAQEPRSQPQQAGSQRQLPEHRLPNTTSLQGIIRDTHGNAIPNVQVDLGNTAGPEKYSVIAGAEGIFRLRNVPLGVYRVTLAKEGFNTLVVPRLELLKPELATLELQLQPLHQAAPENIGPSGIPGISETPPAATTPNTPYPGRIGPVPDAIRQESPPERVPPDSANFTPEPDRWDIALPEWRRYEQQRDTPYVRGHWYDPFNRNRLKGDYPIFGQRWFFNFTGASETSVDGRRVPLPSGVDTEHSGSGDFFGRGEQALLTQNLRFAFDLFRGDTIFRPVDFRLRITPEINLNFLQTRERGIVNIDPREGINRFDTHAGLQEAFVEAKLRDLNPNYDFISMRAGIQQFTSDFRGFLFSEEQPGVRLFGNLRSNRFAYNLAWFYFLEKNTNSGLNTFESRGQQVYVANLYIQDFLAKGYTTELSFHYNRDDAGIHYDDNGFLVRPAPVGAVVNGVVNAHSIRAYYLGWTSNGHIGRINLSHAYYQALGHDDFNPIAGRRVDINARMAALELSTDKDWVRYRASFFYASGDSSNRSGASRTDGTAHGFDTIVDDTHFAGSAFSFWDHEGLRLTGTGIALMNPASLLPSLRSNKEEGQANFVNPGLFLFNAGADFNLSPMWRAFLNANYLRFDRTEPLEILLFQRPIRHGIGTDLGTGIEYRPPLSENIVIVGGVSSLVPGEGFKQIYNGKTLFSVFTTIRFQF